eukprot:COSAG01_NODE_16576_length_1224_cov_1.903111_1_plen_219_part_00
MARWLGCDDMTSTHRRRGVEQLLLAAHDLQPRAVAPLQQRGHGAVVPARQRPAEHAAPPVHTHTKPPRPTSQPAPPQHTPPTACCLLPAAARPSPPRQQQPARWLARSPAPAAPAQHHGHGHGHGALTRAQLRGRLRRRLLLLGFSRRRSRSRPPWPPRGRWGASRAALVSAVRDIRPPALLRLALALVLEAPPRDPRSSGSWAPLLLLLLLLLLRHC